MSQRKKSIANRSMTVSVSQWLRRVAASLGIVAALSAPAYAANIVTNGGFESLTPFAGWLQLNNFSLSGVICPGPGLAPEGSCAAYFGASGTPATLAQLLTTSAGSSYQLSFDFAGAGDTASSFSVTWGSQTLVNLSNPLTTGGNFQVFNFLVQATGPTTLLSFNLRDDNGDLFLDAVSVSAVPEPATIALLGAAFAGVWVKRRRAS